MSYILAIDQGTSSTRALIFDKTFQVVAIAQQAITQFYPQPGWVEHSADEIWQKTKAVANEAVAKAAINVKEIAAIGVTNQRETTVLWDKSTGEVLGPAIVWQDRRTESYCQERRADEAMIHEKSGLCLDPYFSATKLQWALANYPNAMALAKQGQLAFGTIDSFLIWRLTGGQQHVTDITNASRTMLFNINTFSWDKEILEYFDIPESVLPKVLPCQAFFGEAVKDFIGHPIPILGVAGDQQAALIGQACFSKGMTKITYGTGAFLFLNSGHQRIYSNNKLLSTIAYQLEGEPYYGLEGSVFNAGTIVKWLRDNIGLVQDVAETEQLAGALKSNGGVYLVPAFTGLGAPYWQSDVRAQLVGLQLDSDKRHLARAALEAVAYQTRDIVDAMIKDFASPVSEIRVDGGMAVNNYLMQLIADTCGVSVKKPTCIESTARGAAMIAALSLGHYASPDDIAATWSQSSQYRPSDESNEMQKYYAEWKKVVRLCCNINASSIE